MPGRLELIYGCMFAGKTTELIRRLAAAPDSVAVKPRSDTRSRARLATHTGSTLAATEIADATVLTSLPNAVIGIDEAHFFGAPLTPIVRDLASRGRRVIVAGVHLDHRGEPFDPFPQLLPIADEAVQLFAPCALCGEPAIHSHRKQNSASQGRIVVGGADLYEPRCARCFPRLMP